MELILDTSFVLAGERESKNQVLGPARKFVDEHRDNFFRITFTVVGELACGLSVQERRSWEKICRPFPVIPWTREIS